ncbi:DNA-dependent metalloprotease SPRTN [Brachionichthys hirsutus]|uniref:DNA-dependent metalloprotease SPRTN n=1 Tax=Brachionichthys hirsutus TaxID=412623 RepID=UPI003604587C
MDDDLLVALKLQQQFNNEYETSLWSSNGFKDNFLGQSSKKRKVEVAGNDVVPYAKPGVHPERPLSIVDESWETLDPSPDVRAMFLEFNSTFFWGKLSGVEVKWSPRMTLCAGLCSYEGRGGLCSIRLSEPLLKLRPRKDLVETLLHEMIHALLFVTQNNRDRDGHGPEFCKHMNRINQASGTKITVYHSFHDEVDVYRQHWWKCDGPCQNRKPYFGFVKRSMNRAPSSLDLWWGDHERTCGGSYAKVKEPKGYVKKGKKDAKKDERASGSGRPSSTTAGSGSQDIRTVISFSGKGFVLGGKSQLSSPSRSVSSPQQQPITPSPPASCLAPPTCSDLEDDGIFVAVPSTGPASSTGQKKRSVGNARVFVNVNGSPVRIDRPRGGGRNREMSKIRQRSIEELFSGTKGKSQSSSSNSDTEPKPQNATSVPPVFPKRQIHSGASCPGASSPSKPSKYPAVGFIGSKGSPPKATQSKYFSHSNGDLAGSQASRKRPWNDRDGSATVFDFFQKRLGSVSATSRESGKAKAPEIVPPSSSSASPALTVSCPVCRAKVKESHINEHLDSCLS